MCAVVFQSGVLRDAARLLLMVSESSVNAQVLKIASSLKNLSLVLLLFDVSYLCLCLSVRFLWHDGRFPMLFWVAAFGKPACSLPVSSENISGRRPPQEKSGNPPNAVLCSISSAVTPPKASMRFRERGSKIK